VNVYSFDVSPPDNNILFCGTETGFVNKSTDQGQTWQLCACDYYFGGGVTDIGKVFRSSDGGGTWEERTGSLLEYTKCLVIQPTSDGKDLVYLFTTAKNGKTAKVF